MNEDDKVLIRQAIDAIPALAGSNVAALERLGGMTNRVYRLGAFCVRIPGAGTEEYMDRANEAVASAEAANAGVSPDLLHADARTGLMVTRFVDGAATMTPDLFRTRPGAAARAGEAFRRLHSSGAVFPFRFR